MNDHTNHFTSSGTSPTEEHNGYVNRETWAFNLLWANDHNIYDETIEVASSYLAEHPGTSDNNLGSAVVTFWRDRATGLDAEPALRDYFEDVGSWWRVVWHEVGESVRESVTNERPEGPDRLAGWPAPEAGRSA